MTSKDFESPSLSELLYYLGEPHHDRVFQSLSHAVQLLFLRTKKEVISIALHKFEYSTVIRCIPTLARFYLHSAISTTSHLYLVVVILSLLGYYIHTNSTNVDSHSRSRNCEFLGFFFCTYSVFLLIYFMLKLRDLQPFLCCIYLDVFYLLSSKEKSYKKKALDFLSCWDFSFFFCVRLQHCVILSEAQTVLMGVVLRILKSSKARFWNPTPIQTDINNRYLTQPQAC